MAEPDFDCNSACVANQNTTDRSSRFSFYRGHTPRSSCFFYSESQPSVITNAGSTVTYTGGHKQSFSTREVREQHMQIQKKYRPSRKRHFTDPVDFEGILNIIGGCSWWQIWVYLLISLQQIPHAMFNLSVVYMMYQPDHWCKVPAFNQTDPAYKWSLSDAMHNFSIVYPITSNQQRDTADFHDQVNSNLIVLSYCFKDITSLPFILVSLFWSRSWTFWSTPSNVFRRCTEGNQEWKSTYSKMSRMGVCPRCHGSYYSNWMESCLWRQLQASSCPSLLFFWLPFRVLFGWICFG